MSSVRVSLNGGESTYREDSALSLLRQERAEIAEVLFDGPDLGGECDRCHQDGRALWYLPAVAGCGGDCCDVAELAFCHRCVLGLLARYDKAIREVRS